MKEHKFVYKIYIDTSPKKLRNALTVPAKTKKWWHVSFKTDWQVGSTMDVKQTGVTIVDPEQVILESSPHRRLAYTWHTSTREWATVNGLSDDFLAKVAAEKRSHVSFDIERVNGVVRLTVVHGGFETNSTVLDNVSEGWPPLLSSLKTLLETGEPLAYH